MITGTLTCDVTGFAQEHLTEVLIGLNTEQALPNLNYYVKVHCSQRADEPEETPVDEPALLHQHGQYSRFRRVVTTEGSIIEISATSGTDDEPVAYGMYLVHRDKAAPIEERGIHLTADQDGKEDLPSVREVLYE